MTRRMEECELLSFWHHENRFQIMITGWPVTSFLGSQLSQEACGATMAPDWNPCFNLEVYGATMALNLEERSLPKASRKGKCWKELLPHSKSCPTRLRYRRWRFPCYRSRRIRRSHHSLEVDAAH